MNSEYSDIINIDKPLSIRHAKMPMRDRAAQFAPFASLTGFDSQISETARLTDKKPELSESDMESLNKKLRIISDNILSRPEIELIYFVKDSRKSGGSIEHYTGKIRKIDLIKRNLTFEGCIIIPIDDIIDIKAKIINNITEENYG